MTLLLSALTWLYSAARRSIPPRQTGTVIEWAEKWMRDPGSARSERFDASITPWIIEPTNATAVLRSITTFVKPVQSGGSKAGEAAVCYRIHHSPGGDIAYYWPTDEKAEDRWKKRVEKLLRATKPIGDRIRALEEAKRFNVVKGKVFFPHLTLAMLGAYTQRNVESDSYAMVVNEEVHDNDNNRGWLAGRLKQTYGRTTAYWNAIIVNISNAGTKGDQLDEAFNAGTQEHWENKCPGCGLYHPMFTRHEKGKPGGLRYDSDGCRRPDGNYDYNRLAPTIRYEFPCCGFTIRDTPTDRRRLSLSGRYGEPRNAGAHRTHRSFTLQAVAVDYIPWLTLIQEKHEALRALKYGDPEPWKRYRQERECLPWDPEERPTVGKIEIVSGVKKNRDGLRADPNFHARFFALDRQQGHLAQGELPHWWLLIRDALSNGDSRLVYEGKVLTDENVIAILDDHQCMRRHGVADSGDDTTHVYQFCLRHGINAIKGSGDSFFSHGDEGRKIFSPEKPLWQMLNGQPTRDNPLDEPLFWFYSRTGIYDRLAWLRSGGAVKWESPEDVSEDYKRHLEAVEMVREQNKRTGIVETIWRHYSKRYDLWMCECYVAMLMEMAGLIGVHAIPAASVKEPEQNVMAQFDRESV